MSIGRGCRLLRDPGATLVLGAGCEIDVGTTLAVYAGATLSIGQRAFLGHHCTVAAKDKVEVGDGTYLAELVSVRDHDHDVSRPPSSGVDIIEEVTIGRDAWLASKVTVLRGAEIGDRSVIGANAVVRGAIPAGVVAGGIPARILRTLE